MKINEVKNFRTTAILILIILGSVFWIIRVETRAAEFASIVTKYHKMLNQNKDELFKLDQFERSTGTNGRVHMKMTSDNFMLGTHNTWIDMDDKSNKISLSALSASTNIEMVSERGNITLYPNEIVIKTTASEYPITLQAGKESKLKIKDDKVLLHGKKELTLSSGFLGLSFSEIKFTPAKVTLVAFDTKITLDNKMTLENAGSKITIDDQGNIWLEAASQLNLSAKSDINIISENGSVDLFGKRINFNEL